ncbi:MAG: SAM-dependent chlorinase/fluorinase [Gammaproteobacteria bacterium]
MIFLFTDFGLEGPYTGQVQAVLQQQAPGVPVISLFADLTPFDIQSAAYLLPAYAAGLPPGSVFLCVVDPGVGGVRPGGLARADGRCYVGPDEGLFAILTRRARHVECWELPHPATASPSFHARDVFAPLAARLARDGTFGAGPVACAAGARPEWPDELHQVVYIDRYGNAITGTRAVAATGAATLNINGHTLSRARTFTDMPSGTAFWYANSSGLVEIAVNRGRADRQLGIAVGTPFSFS